MLKITEVEVPFLFSRMKNVQKIRPSYNEHTKTKGILVRELRKCVLGYDGKMSGRLTKERITKDVRYQEL